MKVQKGLATWAGIVAALGQYLAAVAVFLQADNQSDALGPLVTATATLLAVIVGRMQQAKAAIENPKPGPVTFSTPMTSSAASAISSTLGGSAGLAYTTPTGTTAYAYPVGTASTADLEEPGDPDALPDYRTEPDPAPDEGDTSANGDIGERES